MTNEIFIANPVCSTFPFCSLFYMRMTNLEVCEINGQNGLICMLKVLCCGRSFIVWCVVCVGVCVGCMPETSVAHARIMHVHIDTHTDDTVTVIRPSQASAHACDVM